MPYLLGIDVSTTGVKALLIDEVGREIGTAVTELALSMPKLLWIEQDPNVWWNGAVVSIRQVLKDVGISSEEIAAIGLTGQMHGLTLLDEGGKVLRPAILWNDQRTAKQCEEIRERLGLTRLVEITGNDALTAFTAPKLLWVREHERDIFARVKHVLLPKDYIRYRLTGKYATDRAGASGTLLLDIRTRDWSDELLQALEIPRAWMPQTYEGPEITGDVSEEAAREAGLKVGTPVVGGGGDQAAQAVGVGAIKPGVVALTLGTSGVVFASTKEPAVRSHSALQVHCHAIPNYWHLMGVMLSAAGSMQWYRNALMPNLEYEKLTQGVKQVQPGAEGLLFLPYLSGERTPYPDPLARGAFVGLTIRHKQAHLIRAIMEGVAFGLRDVIELMAGVGISQINEVRISGGGA
ncbi:xylulokinase, partial [Candidatus Bipolaricaulota bacterium]|nr:xylulokinase [Candidatus Bipolaricaulota bacterium]